jgi:hypothetical protein
MVSISKQARFYKQLAVALLVAVGSWAVFNVARLSLATLLENRFGIVDELTQSLYLAGGIILLLLILGYSFRRSLKQLVR